MNLAWLILASKYFPKHSTYLYLTLHFNISIFSVMTLSLIMASLVEILGFCVS